MADLQNKNIDQISYSIHAKRSKEDAWNMLSARIQENDTSKQKKIFHLNWIVGSAAAVVVFLTILYVGMFNTGKYSPEVFTQNNPSDTIFLPDESIVVLNSNSSCKYHYNKLTGYRNVVLNGEAFFDVQKGRKFEVDCNNSTVNVLGTSFSVMSFSDKYLKVDCLSGKVELEFNNSKFQIPAGKGIKMFNGQIGTVDSINVVNIKNQIKGIYTWEKVSLEEIYYVIGAHFGYKVELIENVKVKNFSGKIDLSNLAKSLTVVSCAMDVMYSIDEETKTITVNAN